MSVINHLKKNIVKYLVYFFVVIIAYGLIEYIFFSPYVEGLSKMETIEIKAEINKSVGKVQKKNTQNNRKQDKKMNALQKSIIDVETDIKDMQAAADESQLAGEEAKASVLESAPDSLKSTMMDDDDDE